MRPDAWCLAGCPQLKKSQDDFLLQADSADAAFVSRMLTARRRLLRQALAIADATTLAAAFATAYLIVGSGFRREFPSFAAYAWLLAPIILIWLTCLSAFGLYCSTAYHSRWALLSRMVQMQSLAGLLLFSAMYLTHSEIVSRLLLDVFVVVSFAFLACEKFALAAYLVRRRAQPQPRKVVLVSDPAKAQRHVHMMRQRISLLADIIRVLTPPDGDGNAPALAAIDLPLGKIEDLPALFDAQVVDEVVAVAPLDSSLLERLSRWCSVRGIVLRIWLDLPAPTVGNWAAEYLDESAFLVSLAAVPENLVYLTLKRAIDVVGAAVGMVICGIVYLWYGRKLRRESGGSTFFCQQRVGRNGRLFTLYKFRTMRLGAEQQKASLGACNQMNGPMFKIKDDPRITSTGRKLRRFYLDELPQFWNVLKGEMSLVGPRPPTKDETVAYGDYHHRRLSMKPGMTGLWQLNGNAAVRNFEEVVKLDCEYIDNWSLWLDATILAKTITKVLHGDGW
jgi:exopolysaccharide biosynthesis polyprenyl glycosylphosphotransferase